MRILHAVHGFPPAATAGVEVYTLRTARAQQALGHDVLVFAAGHDLAEAPGAVRRRRHADVDVVEVNNVHHRGTLRATWDEPEVDAAARALMAEWRPDVLHAQHLANLSAGVVREARLAGAPVVLTLHDHWLSCPRDGQRMRADLALCETVDHHVCAACLRDSPYLAPPLQRSLGGAARSAGLGRSLHRLHEAAPGVAAGAMRLLRRLSPNRPDDLAGEMDRRAAALRSAVGQAAAVVAPTTFVRDRAIEFGVPAERIQVLPLGVVEAAPRARPAGPRRRFGFMGTLAPHKGVHVLVDAFRALPGEDLRLELHGSARAHPDYARQLAERAAGDERIRFPGPFPEGGQERVLASLDALVLPSVWWETTGMVLLEALAAGRVVVASRIGGIPEVVEDGRTGVLVAAGDAGALRQALADLAEGRLLSEALPPLVMKRTQAGALELLEVYRQALAAPDASRMA